DDEEIIIEVGREILEKMGYLVMTARSGQEAVEVYGKVKDQIDMIILDLIMPGMGGGDTYDRLKALNPQVKVLLSSGYTVDGQATEILNRGCNGFIQKPFDIRELSQKIETILH
ncbi:MAG: response regulator, partial [Deltaproteobacteria bacterium]|nr:response regulator [Deltaproteobacteria bacterium]